RTGYRWCRATLVWSSTTHSFAVMRDLFADATYGASHPTIWFGNGDAYNAIYALNLDVSTGYGIQYNREHGGHDEVLAQAGFTNLLFESVPVVRYDNRPDTYLVARTEPSLALVRS